MTLTVLRSSCFRRASLHVVVAPVADTELIIKDEAESKQPVSEQKQSKSKEKA